MHNNKIVHGNLNLQNILINFNKYQNKSIGGKLPEEIKYSDVSFNDSFTLKISDLDMSKEEGKTCPVSSLISDCPNNMAPEIVQSILNHEENKAYSNKIDIWALGEITFELLTGQHPFPGNDNEEIFKKIMEGKYIFPAKIASYEIISFINGLLLFDPERRMDWEQIKSHDFLTKNAENFKFIELNTIKDKDGMEVNSKEGENLYFFLFRNFPILSMDEKKENLSEGQIEKNEEKLDEKKVDNIEIIKAVEDSKNNIKDQEKRLTEVIKENEAKIKELSIQLEEVNIYRKKREKAMKDLEDLAKKQNLKEISKMEEEQELKQLNKLKEEIQTMDGLKEEYDKKFENSSELLKKCEKEKIDAEKELTLINIKEIFSIEELSALKTETDILNFFTLKIDDFNNKIFHQFGRSNINDFIINKVEEIFKNNELIIEITKNIYSKLENLKIDEIKSEDEYNNKILSLFGNAKLP